ncbi:helix-turn-helix domain-containing protein [Bradyrhizobium sp. HKCCYLRH1065]|uniref:helix-turn-helix domain-containing protein n=1 Tax=unclassified Bradyrhizobium TaxID=2631580 RepID=UPI003EBB99C1
MRQEERDAEAGRALKAIRLARGLTQEDLAAQADLDQSALSKVERLGPGASWKQFCRVAAALGCEITLSIKSDTQSSGQDSAHRILRPASKL